MTQGQGEGAQEPWHVPEVREDDLARELPPAVADAAKRAFAARRPGVRVAELVEQDAEERADRRDHYAFRDGKLVVDLDLLRHEKGLAVQVRCTGGPGTRVEVLHGGATRSSVLGPDGSATLEVDPGLLSVIVHPDDDKRPPIQTSWIRIS